MEKNIYFIAKPRANMMENNLLGLGYLPNWDKNFKKLYRKRISIERFFSYLKDHLNLNVNETHSTKALYTCVYSALLASQMLNLDLLKYKTI